MPGLLGVASSRDPESAVARFAAARRRMLRYGRMQADSVRAADGRTVVGAVRLSTAPALAAADRNAVVLHGVLFNEKQLGSGADGRPGTADTTSPLIARYRRDGARFVDQLRGEFCLAVLDESQGRLLIATDAVGSHPVYWRADADGLIFSSDLSALLEATPSSARLDLRAVADYLTIGAVLGTKTLAAGVQVLDPGTVLEYDLRTGRVSHHQYVEIASFFEKRGTSRAQYLESVQHAFRAAVDRALLGAGQAGLSLSGGLDSRAILSAVNGRSASLRTYTLGVDGCADQVIAQQLATIAGSQHMFFPLDRSYLRDFLPHMAQMVSATDGMYLSHGLTEMLALQFLDRTGIQVLLRGHGGELAKAHLAWPLHTDERVYAITSADELVRYLSARANYITPGLPLSRVLAPDAAAAAGEGAPATFTDILAGKGLSAAEACSYLYLRELNRRFTVPSLELFRTRVDVRLPFVDRDFLAVLLGAPPEWRDGTTIHQALTSCGLSKLLKVRNSNTGAPADAGPRREFVLDKVNTVLKRLNVRGYRHYHNFDAWMRSMLLESVEAELLAPGARVHSFIDRGALAGLMRETRDGVSDRAYLLQILLIIELWMRENHVGSAA